MKHRIILASIAALILLIVFVCFHDQLSLAALAGHKAKLRDYQNRKQLLVFAMAFVLYVAASWIPISRGKALLYGWFFGFWEGLLLVDLASMTAVALAFLGSRYVFRETVECRLGDRRDAFNRRIQRHSALYVFELRLIPVFPSVLVSLVMGVTDIRAVTFYWYSQLGMLPMILASVYAGSHFPGLEEIGSQGWAAAVSPQLIVACLLLGLLPLAAKWFFPKLKTIAGLVD